MPFWTFYDIRNREICFVAWNEIIVKGIFHSKWVAKWKHVIFELFLSAKDEILQKIPLPLTEASKDILPNKFKKIWKSSTWLQQKFEIKSFLAWNEGSMELIKNLLFLNIYIIHARFQIYKCSRCSQGEAIFSINKAPEIKSLNHRL